MHNMMWMWTAASKGIDGDRGRQNEGISVEMKECVIRKTFCRASQLELMK
jgi:hypothetical protein